jgi:hypothetical protein
MNEGAPGKRQRAPENWNEVFGNVTEKSDLNETLQADNGLITLTTSDGLEVCPIFQFDKLEDDVVINHHVSVAWSLFLSLQITQLGESPWTKVGLITQPRPDFDGQSWADVLRSPETDDNVRFQIYSAIVGDAISVSQWLGKNLYDPRSTLPN